MKPQYYTAATSLDGYLATEDDSLDWLFPLVDLEHSSYPEFYSHVGALAVGSSTYEWIVRNASRVNAETDSPWPYSFPTWVFSKRKLSHIEDTDITYVRVM